MNLIIGKQFEKQKEGFYIEVCFMEGDADGYQYDLCGPFHEKDFGDLKDFISWIDSLSDQHTISYGAHTYESEADMPEGSDKYILEFNYPNNTNRHEIFYVEWPHQSEAYGCGHCSMDGYSLYYIDKDGNKFFVEIKNDNCN